MRSDGNGTSSFAASSRRWLRVEPRVPGFLGEAHDHAVVDLGDEFVGLSR